MSVPYIRVKVENMEILGVSLAVLGAALAAGLAGAGSSIGVSTAGKTGAGLVAEDDSQFGNVLLLSALPGS